MCEQLAQSCYPTARQPGLEPAVMPQPPDSVPEYVLTCFSDFTKHVYVFLEPACQKVVSNISSESFKTNTQLH